MRNIPQKGQRRLLYLLIALLFVLLVFGGAVVYFYNVSSKNTSQEPKTVSVSTLDKTIALNKITVNTGGTLASVTENSLVFTEPSKKDIELNITEETKITKGERITPIKATDIKPETYVSVSYNNKTRDALSVFVYGE